MGKKVLVIEDNEQNLYLITYILQQNGYEVFQARNGTTGIELADKIRPIMILLDIQLPVMDGYTVAKKLRSNPEIINTPIIAVTSYAMPGDRERALESGCTGYIEKPINPETFMSEVMQYLDSQHDEEGK